MKLEPGWLERDVKLASGQVMKWDEADKQQAAIRKIMEDRKVPFEQAVNIYIKQQEKK